MTLTKCSKCNNPIEDSTTRLFIDDKKTQQVCTQCWWQECRIRFPKGDKQHAKQMVGRN
jgi:hypothetical protein